MNQSSSGSAANQRPDWAADFPALGHLDDQAWSVLAQKSNHQSFAAGQAIFHEGEPSSAYVLLRSGQISVIKHLENGRSVKLYDIDRGCSCYASTALLLTGGTYEATAVAVQDTSLVLLPKKHFLELFDSSKTFRDLVCREFGNRLMHMVHILESTMQRNVLARICAWLIRHAKEGETINATHQSLATELGSVREVVSRNLKSLEESGCIRLTRGRITLANLAKLSALAGGAESLAPSSASSESSALLSAAEPATRFEGRRRDWSNVFEPLHGINDDVWRYVESRAQIVSLDLGVIPFRAGDPCGHYVLVQNGCIKVSTALDSGRELTLYRLGPGEACCAAASGLLREDVHVATAVVEEPATVALIAAKDFRQAFDQSKPFRDFVLASYDRRVSQLMDLLEISLVDNVETRLARYLLQRRGHSEQVHTSHEELAVEVGTAREVVSRNLKLFEKKGWVRLGRRTIDVVNTAALKDLAQPFSSSM